MNEETSTVEMIDRPTGGAAVMIGASLIVVGAMAAILWATTDPLTFLGEIDSDKLQQKYWAGVIAAASISAGLPTLLAGYVVRALYFTEGPEKKPKK